jgi:hypothetical protein
MRKLKIKLKTIKNGTPHAAKATKGKENLGAHGQWSGILDSTRARSI